MCSRYITCTPVVCGDGKYGLKVKKPATTSPSQAMYFCLSAGDFDSHHFCTSQVDQFGGASPFSAFLWNAVMAICILPQTPETNFPADSSKGRTSSRTKRGARALPSGERVFD